MAYNRGYRSRGGYRTRSRGGRTRGRSRYTGYGRSRPRGRRRGVRRYPIMGRFW